MHIANARDLTHAKPPPKPRDTHTCLERLSELDADLMEPLRSHCSSPERLLLAETLADAAHVIRKYPRSSPVWHETRRWLDGDTPARPPFRFRDICDAFELEPEWVRGVLLELGPQVRKGYRTERGTMQRIQEYGPRRHGRSDA